MKKLHVLLHVLMVFLYFIAIGLLCFRVYETGVRPPPMSNLEALGLWLLLVCWLALTIKTVFSKLS